MMSRRGVNELPGPTRISSEHRAVVASSVSLGNESGRKRIARNVASVEEVVPDLQRRESDTRPGACSSAPSIRGDSRDEDGGGASKEPDSPALLSRVGLDQDGDTRLGSFSSASSTQGNDLVGDNESRLQETGSSSSPSSNTGLGRGERSPAAKIWVMHGVMISAVEFVLTLGNAVEEGAFRIHPSGRGLIFGGSTLIEAVGLLCAIFTGFHVLMMSGSKSPVSAGVPAILFVEGVLARSGNAAATFSGESSDSWALEWLLAQGYIFVLYVVAMKGTEFKAMLAAIRDGEIDFSLDGSERNGWDMHSLLLFFCRGFAPYYFVFATTLIFPHDGGLHVLILWYPLYSRLFSLRPSLWKFGKASCCSRARLRRFQPTP